MGMQEFRVPQIRFSMHLVYLVPFVAKESQSEPLTFNLLPLCVPQIRCVWQGLTV